MRDDAGVAPTRERCEGERHPRVSEPLSLEGAHNVRDLGGYETPYGVTTGGAFLRADALAGLTEPDVAALERYGLSLVIDLRASEEAARSRDPFGEGSAHPEVAYEHVPLIDGMNSGLAAGQIPESLASLYCGLLDDSSASIARVMSLLAATEGCGLFHCSAGKDRTGVIAMLLLGLAGVSDEDIVADYAATEGYMADAFKAQRRQLEALGFKLPGFMFESKPESMRVALAHLHERYGTAREYLAWAGCDEVTLGVLAHKLGGRRGASEPARAVSGQHQREDELR